MQHMQQEDKEDEFGDLFGDSKEEKNQLNLPFLIEHRYYRVLSMVYNEYKTDKVFVKQMSDAIYE
jgi:hypothetical protein